MLGLLFALQAFDVGVVACSVQFKCLACWIIGPQISSLAPIEQCTC